MIRLKYKDFEFLRNPSVISVEQSKKLSERTLPFSAGSAVDEIALRPARISFSGSFYGSGASAAAARLAALYNDGGAGELFLPAGEYFVAFLSDMRLEFDAQKNALEYSLKFTESGSGKPYKRKRRCVFARAGQNCFDIAFENGVSVDDVVRLNDLETPFSVEEGQAVRIR